MASVSQAEALRPFAPGDETLVASWSEPGVTPETVLGWHTDPDLEVVPFVLVAGGDDVGYGEVWVDEGEDETELARLVVDPARRGRGLGRALTRLLTEEARRVGLAEIWLRVLPDNAVAIRCYLATGFTFATPEEEAAFNVGQPAPYRWLHTAA